VIDWSSFLDIGAGIGIANPALSGLRPSAQNVVLLHKNAKAKIDSDCDCDTDCDPDSDADTDSGEKTHTPQAGSTRPRTTVMLSGPPRRLASSIKAWVSRARSGSLSRNVCISASAMVE
jgi:hypothetical protein